MGIEKLCHYFHFLFRRYHRLRVLVVLFDYLIQTCFQNGEGRFWGKGINHVSSNKFGRSIFVWCMELPCFISPIREISLRAQINLLSQHSFLCELAVFATITTFWAVENYALMRNWWMVWRKGGEYWMLVNIMMDMYGVRGKGGIWREEAKWMRKVRCMYGDENKWESWCILKW